MTAPVYTPPPTPSTYEGDQHKKILSVGDSFAAQATGGFSHFSGLTSPPVLEPAIAATGRSVEVINEAVPGSGPANNAFPIDWGSRLPGLLDTHQPDILFVHMGGNSNKLTKRFTFLPYGGAGWWRSNVNGTLELMKMARKERIPVYWCLTPAVVYSCAKKKAETKALARYRDWQRFTATQFYPEFVYPDWGTFMTPNNVYTSFLIVDGQETLVRTAPYDTWDDEQAGRKNGAQGDCIHFTAAGVAILAQINAWYLAQEWT